MEQQPPNLSWNTRHSDITVTIAFSKRQYGPRQSAEQAEARKILAQDNTVAQFKKIFEQIDTFFQSIPRHHEIDKATGIYTKTAINSWYLHSLTLISSRGKDYQLQRDALQQACDSITPTIQRHFGDDIPLKSTTKINPDPQEQFLLVLRQITAFYDSIPNSYERSYKQNAAYLAQTSVLTIFTTLLSALAFTQIPLDYYFSEYFSELKNINRAINQFYLLRDPPSTIPVTFYKPS